MYESLGISSGPVGFIAIMPAFIGELPLHPQNVKDGAWFHKGKKPPHASSLTPTEEPNILPDICCFFSLFLVQTIFLSSQKYVPPGLFATV